MKIVGPVLTAAAAYFVGLASAAPAIVWKNNGSNSSSRTSHISNAMDARSLLASVGITGNNDNDASSSSALSAVIFLVERNTDGSVKPGASVTEQSDQIVTITQLVPPKLCRRRATTDDLLEISYVGQVLETGAIFDGSAVKINGEAIPGRGNDLSVFFVLGKQPFGQFPPGWDVGLDGMCVGERRRLIIPPVLAYGSVGVPRRGIPPNATLQYDVTLVSLNGLATPQ